MKKFVESLNKMLRLHLTNRLQSQKLARTQNAFGEHKFCFTKTLLITGHTYLKHYVYLILWYLGNNKKETDASLRQIEE